MSPERRHVLYAAVFGLTLLAVPSLIQGRQTEIPTVGPDGVHALIAEREGKVVVVNFWASWCPPCVEEFPELIRFYNDYRDEGVELLAVSMNAVDEIDDVRDFLSNYDATFPTYMASTQELSFMEGISPEWYGEMPTTLVVDQRGGTVAMHKSAVTYDQLAEDVGALLSAEPVASIQEPAADFAIVPHHVGISVPDLDASIDWYRRMLGFEVVRQPPERTASETRIALISRGDAYIELFEIPGATPLPEYRRDASADLRVHGIKHFSFEVEDAGRALEILREKGAEIALELRDGERTAYFFVRDNSGNTFELIEYKER